ncbi:type I secretion C-terminal target domain (VC_A0849 subclass) [Pedobacter westerhofensis]|uniref:Type I secretion C-terminal target domain (VC_A0849 subclass) n=1 Tax=Pedobacter westerhofensis TaxID=425512 RepID=A0A521F3Y0_9SPHI|nr:HmuY family protein [Pedobacter westerhofensis]SMO90893.1 type I secretion C-terminal target domain (VC_A0849 subclass) [Pedobacter westerhofensis]
MIRYAIAIVFCYMLFVWLGCKKDTIKFYRLQPSAGDTVTLRGIFSRERADSAYNSAFLDFSTNTQTAVVRSSWDLGFYCGTDFRVIINHTVGAAVAVSDKTDLNAVTIADTVALVPRLTLNSDTGDLTTVDPVAPADSAAYLAGTAIPSVPGSSKILILNRGRSTNLGRRNWIKMKITATNSGYSVTWGTITINGVVNNNNLYSSFSINKDASYNFRYYSFSSSAVTYEPAKTLWDISYGQSTYKITGNDGITRPVPTTDFMLINFVNGVKAAQLNDDPSGINYANIDSTKLAAITFSGARDVIGVNWRTVALVGNAANSGAIEYNTKVFYLIKDRDNSVYAVSFAGGGSRGAPIVRYRRIYNGPFHQTGS